jgi:hypothetical protein
VVLESGRRACEAPHVIVAAVVLALALLVLAVSWGREMDDAAPDVADRDRGPDPRSA